MVAEGFRFVFKLMSHRYPTRLNVRRMDPNANTANNAPAANPAAAPAPAIAAIPPANAVNPPAAVAVNPPDAPEDADDPNITFIPPPVDRDEFEGLTTQVHQMQENMAAILDQLKALRESFKPANPVTPDADTVVLSTPGTTTQTSTHQPLPDAIPFSPISHEETFIGDFAERHASPGSKEIRESARAPSFSGNNTTAGDATIWTHAMRIYFKNRNMTGEVRKISTAVLALTGSAHKWGVRNEASFESYENFEKAFLIRWEALDLYQIVDERLAVMTYKSNVEDLFEEFTQQVSLTKEMWRYPVWIRSCFISKLPPELRSYVYTDLADLKLEEMIPRLKQRELSNERQKQFLLSGQASGSKPCYQNHSKGSSKPAPSSTTNSGAAKARPVPPNIYKERIERGECGLCSSKDHSVKDCPKRASKRNSAGSSSAGRSN